MDLRYCHCGKLSVDRTERGHCMRFTERDDVYFKRALELLGHAGDRL